MQCRRQAARVAVLTPICIALLTPALARASCNVIPGVNQIQRSAVGEVNRPFASPGDPLGIRVNPALCDDASPGIASNGADHVVTVLFTPPSGTSSAVVLSSDCAGISSQVSDCATQVTGATACREDANALSVRTQSDGQRELFFRFPDTDDLTGPPADGIGLAGPTKIVVTRASGPNGVAALGLGCELATQPCTTGATNRVACVDEFFEVDGTCNTAVRGLTFSHFTALPPPNDFGEACTAPVEICSESLGGIAFTTDVEGHVFIPWDYGDVIAFDEDVPIARVGTADLQIRPFEGQPAVPIRVPRKRFLSSHAPQGLRLPPIFTPLADPDVPDGTGMFGTIDARRAVTRIARRAPVGCPDAGDGPCYAECTGGSITGPCTRDTDCGPGGTCGGTSGGALCRGGSNDGGACVRDAECPDGGECGPGLFDFQSRYTAGVGPIIVDRNTPAAGEDFELRLQESVPLSGLEASDEVLAFVVNERIADVGDTNADLDNEDFVVTLASATTGMPQAIGAGGAAGRAVPRFAEPPFRFPAVATEGPLLAFLEDEPSEGNAPGNQDGDDFDAVVRAFALGTPDELLGRDGITASALAAPLLDGEALALSDGMLFFLSPEAMGASFAVERASDDPFAADPANSFAREPNLAAGGRALVYARDRADMIVLDRDLGTHSIVSGACGGMSTSGQQEDAAVSADGRYVAWNVNVVGVQGNQICVLDLDTTSSALVGVDVNGALPAFAECPGGSDFGFYGTRISRTGRFVSFTATHDLLDGGDQNASCPPGGGVLGQDVYLHDRDADEDGILDERGPGEFETVRVSLRTDGTEHPEGIGASFTQRSHETFISDDGRFVAFVASNPMDPIVEAGRLEGVPGRDDVYLHDRDADGDGIFDAGRTIWVSAPFDGASDTGNDSAWFNDLSPDGRFVAFSSRRNTIVPNDTNAGRDIFVYAVATGAVTRENVTFENGEIAGETRFAALSADGRALRFESSVDGVVDGDADGLQDTFWRLRRDPNAIYRILQPPSVQIPPDEESNPRRSTSDALVDHVSVSAAVLDAGDVNGGLDIFLTAPEDAEIAVFDANLDGDLGDVTLRAIDLTQTPVVPYDLGESEDVAVFEGAAAFLRPERSGAPASRNADADTNDLVVHLWEGRPNGGGPPDPEATRLGDGRAATHVEMSAEAIAALVSEVDQGTGSLNGDSDDDDLVPQLWDRAAEAWVSTGEAAQSLSLRGAHLAYLAPESGASEPPGIADFTGDADDADRVIRLFALGTGAIAVQDVLGRAQPAEDFVLGPDLLAFRTHEADFCPDGVEACVDCDLNGDGVCDDDVLQVFDLVSGELRNSGSTIVPCDLEACNPRTPYRVGANTVRFLTDESLEGRILNDDQDMDDLLVQLFRVRGEGVGLQVVGQVARAPVAIQGEEVDIDPVEVPPLDEEGMESQVFLSVGFCVEDIGTPCAADDQCGVAEFCGVDGTCRRQGATCRVGAEGDCSPFETCVEQIAGTQNLFAVVSSPDQDGDEVVDSIDNCPTVSNLAQLDLDRDGIGDACDDETCGNGAREGDEFCDGGGLCADDATSCTSHTDCVGIGNALCRAANLNGCTRFCRTGGCPGDVDLDGTVDLQDAGLFFDPEVAGCYPCGSDCNEQCDVNGDGIVSNPDSLGLQNLLGTQCAAPQASSACGLGGELALLAAFLPWLRRRLYPLASNRI